MMSLALNNWALVILLFTFCSFVNKADVVVVSQCLCPQHKALNWANSQQNLQ